MSHAAKGKAVCSGSECEFLVAAPVNSFYSGDSNRDLHMLEATRGADFPMVVVRGQFPESQLDSSTIDADIEVRFSGQTAHYAHLAFQRTIQGDETRIVGTVPATCSDFGIVRPTFLGMSISDSIPVKVDLTWQPVGR